MGFSARYNVHCGHVALSGGGEAQISAGYGRMLGGWLAESGELRALGLTTVIITSHFPVLSPSLVAAFLPIIIILLIRAKDNWSPAKAGVNRLQDDCTNVDFF